MPTQTTVNMLFVGTFASVDTDESDGAAENAANLIGNYDNLEITSIVENDQNDDGAIFDDEFQAAAPPPEGVDFLSYDVGFGPESYQLDSTSAFNAVVTLADGSTQDVLVAVLQTTIGDVFIRDVGNALDNLNIQSIELVSVANNTFSGSVTGNSIENSQVVCILEGTMIATPSGNIRVEALRVGQDVCTFDGAATPIVWRHSQPVGAAPAAQPIQIDAGALGAGLPKRPICVSPNHRVMLRSRIAQRMFSTAEVMLPAKRLVGLPGIRKIRADPAARYHHILLKRHALLIAEGAPIESFYPGKMALLALDALEKRDLRKALSAIGHPAGLGYLLARIEPSGSEQRRLVWRHRRNQVPLLDVEKTPA